MLRQYKLDKMERGKRSSASTFFGILSAIFLKYLPSTRHWKSDNMSKIEVPKDLVEQLENLEAKLAPHTDKPKCEWPLDLMAEIHTTASQITKVVGKELYSAMQWPTIQHSHPEGFYAGAHNIDPNFQRPKTGWLETQGYTMHKTTYTYGNRWDRVPITAAFYVPDNLQAGDEVPMMWHFHGGGYVSTQPYLSEMCFVDV